MWERGERKTGIGWKERKEGAECAMRRERNEREREREREGRMKTEGR
jgi:hypothetical protein